MRVCGPSRLQTEKAADRVWPASTSCGHSRLQTWLDSGEASALMAANPLSLELRRMQMITEVGAEQNTTTIVMMPSEFVTLAENLANKFRVKAE